MSSIETVIAGTIQPDGSLVLDEKTNLPPGRVTVVVRREAEITVPNDDPFWQRMQAMWAIPKSGATAGDGGAASLRELEKLRAEWDEHQTAIETRPTKTR